MNCSVDPGRRGRSRAVTTVPNECRRRGATVTFLLTLRINTRDDDGGEFRVAKGRIIMGTQSSVGRS